MKLPGGAMAVPSGPAGTGQEEEEEEQEEDAKVCFEARLAVACG